MNKENLIDLIFNEILKTTNLNDDESYNLSLKIFEKFIEPNLSFKEKKEYPTLNNGYSFDEENV